MLPYLYDLHNNLQDPWKILSNHRENNLKYNYGEFDYILRKNPSHPSVKKNNPRLISKKQLKAINH